MSAYEWIVCEGRGKWAAALRLAVARQAPAPLRTPRVYELRSLDELAERLAVKPHSLALVELHADNLAQVLSWSAKLPLMDRHARFVGLVDRSLTAEDDGDGTTSRIDRARLVDVLLEAGTVEIVFSPRYLPGILPTIHKHFEMWARRREASGTSQAITDWAWSLLPWQSE